MKRHGNGFSGKVKTATFKRSHVWQTPRAARAHIWKRIGVQTGLQTAIRAPGEYRVSQAIFNCFVPPALTYILYSPRLYTAKWGSGDERGVSLSHIKRKRRRPAVFVLPGQVSRNEKRTKWKRGGLTIGKSSCLWKVEQL